MVVKIFDLEELMKNGFFITAAEYKSFSPSEHNPWINKQYNNRSMKLDDRGGLLNVMKKFDADKDGQLSDAEKEAAKAEFQKHAPKCGKKGHRRPCCAPKCEQK